MPISAGNHHHQSIVPTMLGSATWIVFLHSNLSCALLFSDLSLVIRVLGHSSMQDHKLYYTFIKTYNSKRHTTPHQPYYYDLRFSGGNKSRIKIASADRGFWREQEPLENSKWYPKIPFGKQEPWKGFLFFFWNKSHQVHTIYFKQG